MPLLWCPNNSYYQYQSVTLFTLVTCIFYDFILFCTTALNRKLCNMGTMFCRSAPHNSYFCAIALLETLFWPGVAKRPNNMKEGMNLGVSFCDTHDYGLASTHCQPVDWHCHAVHHVPFCTGPAIPSGTPAGHSYSMRNPCSSKAVIRQSTNVHALSVAKQTKIAGPRRGTFILTSPLWSLCTPQSSTQSQPAFPQVQGFLTRHRVSSQGETTSRKPAEEASWADVELFFTNKYRAGAKKNVYEEQVHSTPVPTYHQEQVELLK